MTHETSLSTGRWVRSLAMGKIHLSSTSPAALSHGRRVILRALRVINQRISPRSSKPADHAEREMEVSRLSSQNTLR
jgi:hypothetical protein